MNQYCTKSANVNPGPSKETCLHYYKESMTNNSLQENYWNRENIIDEIITMEKLEETLKKQKNVKSPGKDNLNSELYKYARGSFYGFLKSIR